MTWPIVSVSLGHQIQTGFFAYICFLNYPTQVDLKKMPDSFKTKSNMLSNPLQTRQTKGIVFYKKKTRKYVPKGIVEKLLIFVIKVESSSYNSYAILYTDAFD